MAEPPHPNGSATGRYASGDEHLAAWADLHMTETPTGFVGGWLKATAGIARPLARAGVSPDAVTVAALVAAAASVPLAGLGRKVGPAAACLAVTVSGVLDALDGAVAVQAGRTTKVGFLLDSALDRIADAALPGALAVTVARADPARARRAGRWAVAAGGCAWWLEYVRARSTLALPPERQVVTPGERPTRIVINAFGLGLPVLAPAALKAQVVIVGGSALHLFVSSLRRLRRHDLADRPAPTRGSPG